MYWSNSFIFFSVLPVTVVFRWNFEKTECVVFLYFLSPNGCHFFSLFLSIYKINKMIHIIHIHTGIPVEIYSHCDSASHIPGLPRVFSDLFNIFLVFYTPKALKRDGPYKSRRGLLLDRKPLFKSFPFQGRLKTFSFP